MFFTAANLYGELVWELRNLPCEMFGKQLAARLWELDGQRVALGCRGWASWMLGTANCLNGAVITLVLNYLIGPFVFDFSLIDLSYFLSL